MSKLPHRECIHAAMALADPLTLQISAEALILAAGDAPTIPDIAAARAEGRREGLEEAAKLARENEACHVCGCELLAPEGKPYCEYTCHSSKLPPYEIDHDGFIPTSDRIRALLAQSPPKEPRK